MLCKRLVVSVILLPLALSQVVLEDAFIAQINEGVPVVDFVLPGWTSGQSAFVTCGPSLENRCNTNKQTGVGDDSCGSASLRVFGNVWGGSRRINGIWYTVGAYNLTFGNACIVSCQGDCQCNNCRNTTTTVAQLATVATGTSTSTTSTTSVRPRVELPVQIIDERKNLLRESLDNPQSRQNRGNRRRLRHSG